MQILNRRNLFSGAMASILCSTFSSASIAQTNHPTRLVTSEPALPRLVKLNSDIVVTTGTKAMVRDMIGLFRGQ